MNHGARARKQPPDACSSFRLQVRGGKHVAKIGVRATILAPVAFMKNLFFIKERLEKGIYAAALGARTNCRFRYWVGRRSRPRGLVRVA
jgi:hypothetical protein